MLISPGSPSPCIALVPPTISHLVDHKALQLALNLEPIPHPTPKPFTLQTEMSLQFCPGNVLCLSSGPDYEIWPTRPSAIEIAARRTSLRSLLSSYLYPTPNPSLCLDMFLVSMPYPFARMLFPPPSPGLLLLYLAAIGSSITSSRKPSLISSMCSCLTRASFHPLHCMATFSLL